MRVTLKRTTIWYFIAALVLMLIHNHADYLLQAYQHGWATWLDLHGRAAAWPWYLDFLPRDAWHAVQTIRNQTVIAGTLITSTFVWDLISENYDDFDRPPRWWYVALYALPFVFYGLTRAVAFSLVKELLN